MDKRVLWEPISVLLHNESAWVNFTKQLSFSSSLITWTLWRANATSDMLTHTGTPGQASSPPPSHTDSHQVNEKMETVLFQLRHVTRERDELRKRLALSSPGTTFDDCRYCSGRVHISLRFLSQTLIEKCSDRVCACTY